MKKLSILVLAVFCVIKVSGCGAFIAGFQEGLEKSTEQSTIEPTPKSSAEPSIKPSSNPTSGNIAYELTYQEQRLRDSMLNDAMFEIIIGIENTGDVALYLSSQKFDLVDVDGKIAATGSLSAYPSFLNPGEKGVFYESVSLNGYGVDADILFEPRWSIVKAKKERVDFDLSGVEIRDGGFGGVTAYGRIANNTGEEQSWAVIEIIMYGHDGNPLGVLMTNVMEDMPNGVTLGFDVTNIMGRSLFDKITLDMIAHFEAYATTVQFQW
jgi:hypothetical protein